MIAAITAGGKVDPAFAAAIGTTVKALAPFGETKLIDASIDAARGAGAQRIIVVGGPDVGAHCEDRVDQIVAATDNGRENLSRALGCANGNDLLLLTSDLPFVTAEQVRAFLRCTEGADIAMPLALEADYQRAFPGAPNHAIRIGSEAVVNGSIFYFAPGVSEKVDAIAGRFFEARKSLWRMAAITGPILLVKYTVGRLKIRDIEVRAQVALGADARAVRHCAPGLCYDVDTFEDYRYAIEHRARG